MPNIASEFQELKGLWLRFSTLRRAEIGRQMLSSLLYFAAALRLTQ